MFARLSPYVFVILTGTALAQDVPKIVREALTREEEQKVFPIVPEELTQQKEQNDEQNDGSVRDDLISLRKLVKKYEEKDNKNFKNKYYRMKNKKYWDDIFFYVPLGLYSILCSIFCMYMTGYRSGFVRGVEVGTSTSIAVNHYHYQNHQNSNVVDSENENENGGAFFFQMI